MQGCTGAPDGASGVAVAGREPRRVMAFLLDLRAAGDATDAQQHLRLAVLELGTPLRCHMREPPQCQTYWWPDDASSRCQHIREPPHCQVFWCPDEGSSHCHIRERSHWQDVWCPVDDPKYAYDDAYACGRCHIEWPHAACGGAHQHSGRRGAADACGWARAAAALIRDSARRSGWLKRSPCRTVP